MSNAISMTGNLGKDATLKEVGSSKVLSFSLANSIGFGDKKQTLWFNCSMWGNAGEKLQEHLTKGKNVFVTGELSTHEYEGKTHLDVKVNSLDFTG